MEEENAVKPIKRLKSNKRILFLGVFIIVVCIVVWFIAKERVNSPVTDETEIVTYSTDSPSEEKPGDNYVWKGSPQNPNNISINSVGINSYIQAVGVDQNKEVAVPSNIHLAGWFTSSVSPGQKGLSIIDGHVNGRTQDGVFKNLPDVQKDDEVLVTLGNGTVNKFKVFEITEVGEPEAASILFSQNPKVSNQLNLITCVGSFNQNTRRYDKRVIVSAELVQ